MSTQIESVLSPEGGVSINIPVRERESLAKSLIETRERQLTSAEKQRIRIVAAMREYVSVRNRKGDHRGEDGDPDTPVDCMTRVEILELAKGIGSPVPNWIFTSTKYRTDRGLYRVPNILDPEISNMRVARAQAESESESVAETEVEPEAVAVG